MLLSAGVAYPALAPLGALQALHPVPLPLPSSQVKP